jgi:CRP-like cAMP-binding protein
MIAIMSEEILDLLAPMSPRLRRYRMGAPVFRLGDTVRSVHVVRSGLIHLMRHRADGAALVMERARPGAILAEASVFAESYHCDGVAISETETWSVPREALRHRIAADGSFAAAWARRLGHEIQKVRLLAEILATRTVAARLDAWLAWHGALPPRGEWVGLAAEIGVSPEALYREMAKRRR